MTDELKGKNTYDLPSYTTTIFVRSGKGESKKNEPENKEKRLIRIIAKAEMADQAESFFIRFLQEIYEEAKHTAYMMAIIWLIARNHEVELGKSTWRRIRKVSRMQQDPFFDYVGCENTKIVLNKEKECEFNKYFWEMYTSLEKLASVEKILPVEVFEQMKKRIRFIQLDTIYR